MAKQRRKLAAPLWLGEGDVAGKTILLHAEQGFGDTIQFVRYAPLLAARGARVLLEVQPQLVRLLSGLAGVAQVLPRRAPLPPFDLHCPLLSLPLAFGTALDSIPDAIPYIARADEAAALWRERFDATCADRRPRIGLIWSGERAHDNDLNRSHEPCDACAGARAAGRAILQHAARRARGRCAVFLQTREDVPQIGQKFSRLCRHGRGDCSAGCRDRGRYGGCASRRRHGQAALFAAAVCRRFPLAARAQDSPWYPTARLFRQPAIRRLGRCRVEALREALRRAAFSPADRLLA